MPIRLIHDYYDTEIKGTIETGADYVYYNPDGTVAADGRIVAIPPASS